MMAVTFTPGTDFEDVTDGLEAVTLIRTGSDTTAITNALQRAIEDTEITASEGRLKAGDVRWHFPTVEAATTPRMGDVIKDAAGDRYTVLSVQDATLEKRFRCAARNLRVVYGLDDTVTIEQAFYVKGDGGAMEPDHWDIVKAGLRARIQPLQSDISVENEGRRTVRNVAVMVEVDIEPNLDITQQHRVRAADGTIYNITGFEGAEQIGDVPVILAEETPWPMA